MQITFAGTIIAQEPDFGGFDAVTGFVPKGKGSTEWQGALRAEDDTPFARSNRRRTVGGKIIFPPQSTLAEAMLLRSTEYNNLPDAGSLSLQVGNIITTFANAVLDTHEALEDQQGEAVGFQLSFSVGRGVAASVLLSQAGLPLLSQSGAPLESQQSPS